MAPAIPRCGVSLRHAGAVLDRLRSVLVCAVFSLIGGIGYLSVTKLGWRSTAGLLGFEVVSLLDTPESQCNRAREPERKFDGSFRCVSDRDWLETFYKRCPTGEDTA